MGLLESTLSWIASRKIGSWLAPLLRAAERLAKWPPFEKNPADLVAAYADHLTDRGQLRQALRSAVNDDHADLWLWERTVDRLLDDVVGAGAPSEQAVLRLELACQQLYEEGWTTLWQYAYAGGLGGIERRLWRTAATRSSQQLDSELIGRVLYDLARGDVTCHLQDHRWKLLDSLAVRGRSGHFSVLGRFLASARRDGQVCV